MKNSVFTKQKKATVNWRNLIHLNTREKIYNTTIFLPWLCVSLLCAYHQHYFAALFCSFVFFLTGLRLAHDAFHESLQIPRWGHHVILTLLSICMLCSMHAVKHNHLLHHKHCLTDKDMEGYSARLKWWQAIAYGPVFIFLHHYYAIKNGNSTTKTWVITELILLLLMVLLATLTINPVLQYHTCIMIAGEFLTAFFAVWTVHHDCENDKVFSRTLRGKYMPAIFYNMFYHTEHHLYPKVPTCHLPELANRIDTVFPEIKSKQVF